jgi:anti-sigma regulatory factor (Ser/Thr protein kinase)
MVNATLHAFEGIERREVTVAASLIKNERIDIDVVDNGRGIEGPC